MKFEFDEIDRQHADIMEKLAVLCRSNKSGFKKGKTDRIDRIRELAAGSGYHEILLPGVQLWRKGSESPIDVIVSSHVDTAGTITGCHSRLTEDGYYKGTFDNAGTNSAAVIAMLEGDIPETVMFAFTSEEESGLCLGARQALEYARNLGNEPVCVALDVTYEGYRDGSIFTMENLSSGHKKDEDKTFLNQAAAAVLSLEPEGYRTCLFVKKHKNAVPDVLPKEYVARGSGMFDEAFAYIKEHARAFSLCLPCKGDMHGNSGVSIRQPSFEGYVNILESMLYNFTRTHGAAIAAKRIENATLTARLIDMVKEELEEENKRREEYYGFYDRCGVYDQYDDYPESGSYQAEDPFEEFMDEVCEACYGYDACDKEIFISDMKENLPYDLLGDYDPDELTSWLSFLFDEVHNIDYGEDGQSTGPLKEQFRYDEDGFEYGCSLFGGEDWEREAYGDKYLKEMEGENQDFDVYEDFERD